MDKRDQNASQAHLLLLKQTGLFEQLSSAELKQLGAVAKLLDYRPGEIILREIENIPSILHIIASGQVLVWQSWPDGIDEMLYQRGPGAYFGPTVGSGQSYQALTPVETLWLGPAEFDRWVRPHFEQISRQSQIQTNLVTLKQIRAFWELPLSYLEEVAKLADRQHYAPLEIIVQPHEQDYYLHIIESGQVGLFAWKDLTLLFKNPGEFNHLIVRGPGDFFGLPSLFNTLPPGDIGAVALGDTWLLAISPDPQQAGLLHRGELHRYLSGLAKRLKYQRDLP